ncbi:MAG: HAD-IIB family hydrolase [Gammaproteobacteria bacterium]
MPEKFLVCTDLDRTLLPNGEQNESPQAASRFKQLVSRNNVFLTYVSGRHKALILDAINDYHIPLPDYAIGDVGTTIYEIKNNNWTSWQAWQDEIAPDWNNHTGEEIHTWLTDLAELRLQEKEKQNRFKLSYYALPTINVSSLLAVVEQRLKENHVKANLVWSIDETTDTGLLDILPISANKLHAIRFLLKEKGFTQDHCIFAGDSGNDLEVMCSDIPSVLVNNATDDVKGQAIQMAQANGTYEQLYLAQGNFLGMNGNYAAGILEGLAHYHPQLLPFIES